MNRDSYRGGPARRHTRRGRRTHGHARRLRQKGEEKNEDRGMRSEELTFSHGLRRSSVFIPQSSFLSGMSSVLAPHSSVLPHTSSIFIPPSSILSGKSSILRPHSSFLSAIDPEYCRFALHRLDAESGPLFGHAGIEYRKAGDFMASAAVTAVAEGTRNEDRRVRNKGRRMRVSG